MTRVTVEAAPETVGYACCGSVSGCAQGVVPPACATLSHGGRCKS